MAVLNVDYSNLNHDEMAESIGIGVKHIPILIESFLEESAATLNLLSDAIDTQNLELLRAHAHSIKGSAGNLKFNEIYEMAKEMEFSAAAQSKDFDYRGNFEGIRVALTTIPH